MLVTRILVELWAVQVGSKFRLLRSVCRAVKTALAAILDSGAQRVFASRIRTRKSLIGNSSKEDKRTSNQLVRLRVEVTNAINDYIARAFN